ncbi:MAG: hypothetical protein BWY31_01807 [Lentisphaerae bacterium ADurb.Bin242]|nr:MAG: hypothetical protein BWY31_01807 [Lentisphaerae bacterium ADurb.Bin242]
MKKLLLIITGIVACFCLRAESVRVADLTISENPAAERLTAGLKAIYKKEFPVEKNGKITFAPGDHQGYTIRTAKDGIVITGNAEYAVSHILHSLGMRHFFSSPNWLILPENPPATLDLDVKESPAWFRRSIWPGWGLWHDYRGEGKIDDLWRRQNRLGGVPLSTGHAYGMFISKNKAEFEKHPEYYALVNGKRDGSKLCISNPGVRKLYADWATKLAKSGQESVSCDPTDGGGWCECAECARLGNITDRALTLANEVARAVGPNCRIGMYAYNQHSPPPSRVKPEPNVVISIATLFIREGWTVDALIREWGKTGAVLGIREYYYAHIAPGAMSKTKIANSIDYFHSNGARFMSAESTDAWGPGGLVYYMAARLLWNPKEDREAILDDFFARAFPKSEKPMREFYSLIDGDKPRPLSADLLGRMYRTLAEARKTAAGQELARVNDLVCYTRFCELFFLHRNAPTAASYNNLLRFGAAIRDTRMVHTYAMHRDTRNLLHSSIPKDKLEKIEWQRMPPPTDAELAKFVSEGIANNALLDFEAVEFGQDLVPVTVSAKKEAGQPGPVRRTREFLIWSDGSPLELKVTGGLIKHYRNRGNVKLSLVQIGGVSETGELETVVARDESVPPDGQERNVTLRPKHAGLHRVVSSDGGDMTNIVFPEDSLCLSPGGDGEQSSLSGTRFFYVPKGMESLGFYAKMTRCSLFGPDGKQVAKQAYNGYYSIPAKPGVWKVVGAGIFQPMTVPSGLSFRSDRMLLPREVAGKDFRK